MSDYQIVRTFLLAEEDRRKGYYKYRLQERGAAMAKVAGALAALERLRVAAEWRAVGKWWTDKFD